jgi:Acetylornithine deacetylase/Succinyl-diaminopimelate desuccinylase and related deacylases
LIERLKEDMINLGEIGKQETGGISRPSFSDYDIEARKYVLKRFKEAGLMIHIDAAGNIIGIRPGKVESPIVTTGSHIDSVWNGGMFDGTLGVISGLEAIRMLNDSNIKTDLPIALIVFTDEEGAFSSLTGSSYFAGLLKKEELYELKNKYDGKNLKKDLKKSQKKVMLKDSKSPLKVMLNFI